MRRTNTDYKFNEDITNEQYYSSTHSLKVNEDNNNSNSQSNLEFDYYFNHLCHIADHNGICRYKSILSHTHESGIGSSISSIDTHCNLGFGADDSSINHSELDQSLSPTAVAIGNGNGNCHFDYRDLPPVTEEEDGDAFLGIMGGSGGTDNRLLDALPWRDSADCQNFGIACCHGKRSICDSAAVSSRWLNYCLQSKTDDTSAIFASNDAARVDHIERPWVVAPPPTTTGAGLGSSRDCGGLNPVVLSSICHNSSADCLLESELHLSRLNHTNVISDRAIMYKVFQKRHSITNDWSGFTYKIKSLMTIDNEDGDDYDELLQGSISD